MYILLEGVDTSGKSTQIELLKKSFKDAIFTKEPGGSSLGVEIRKILLNSKLESKNAELLLFLADRAEHYESVVKKNENRYIFSDRGFISGMAYAMANSTDLELDFLISLNNFVLSNKQPNLVILLKTNEDLIKERMDTKKRDEIEKRGVEYLLRVQNNMEKILEKLELNYITIDSSRSIEDIYKEICLKIESMNK